MGRKKTAGLYKRKGIWHIDKQIKGYGRLCETCGTDQLEEAERYLVKRLEEIRQATVYGLRPVRTFEEAAVKFVRENAHKRSIAADASRLNGLNPYIGQVHLHQIHIGTLHPYIEAKKADGRKTRTINHGLKVVRHILNLAALEWIDEHGLTWLEKAPKIKLLPECDGRKPHPLTWEEQDRLFKALPSHLERMALFSVNTGCRDQEVCRLRWDWEIPIKKLDTSFFLLPETASKNGEEGLIVLNRVAFSIVESQRGNNSDYVFTYRGKPLARMLSTGWRQAREKAKLDVRVHNLRHTFGRRLRSAGVSYEDRQDLLRHKSTRMTTHYSKAELRNLIDAANTVCERGIKPELILIRNAG